MIDEMDSYRFHDAYSLQDAAALICGLKPSSVLRRNRKPIIQGEEGAAYQATLTGLVHAVSRGTLPAEQQPGAYYSPAEPEFCDGSFDYAEPTTEVDPATTTVSRDDLMAWLASRNFRPPVFFPTQESRLPGYLDKTHPHYAPKLAAAVRAWEAVSGTPNLLAGRHPKQALKKWLKDHAADYALIKESGLFNADGIENISKVANWQSSGGAGKTPNRKPPSTR